MTIQGIYRLDRLTSGVLIFCKSEAKTKELMQSIKDRKVQKEYVCRVDGQFPRYVKCLSQILICTSIISINVITWIGNCSHNKPKWNVASPGRTSCLRNCTNLGMYESLKCKGLQIIGLSGIMLYGKVSEVLLLTTYLYISYN